jgi:hypothetical protein
MVYLPKQLISNSMAISKYLVGNYVVVACYNFYNFNGLTRGTDIIPSKFSGCPGRNLKQVTLEYTSQKIKLLGQLALW